MNTLEESVSTAFADLLDPAPRESVAHATATAPTAWIAVSDAAMVRAIARELMHQGWRIGLATTRLAQVHRAFADGAVAGPQLLISGIRFVDGDAFDLIRELHHCATPPGLLLVSHQQRAVIRSALALAGQLGLRGIDCCELPSPVTGIVQQALEVLASAASASQRPARRSQAPLDRAALQTLLDQRRIVPYFQPKMSVTTGEILGFEALMRADDTRHGFITPDRLIAPLLEHGLLAAATLQMAKQTLDMVADCLRQGWPISSSLNVSLSLMSDKAFCNGLLSLVNASGVDPSWITLEITETEAMSDLATVIEQTGRIRMFGFNLSIDDFGTAYSSFFQLSQIPFSELKIERAFVSGMDTDPTRRAIVTACSELGKGLGLHVVAEGVETAGELACLRDTGCELVQGYLISRPMSGAAAKQWLAEQPGGA
jgi:EAL domain-containing protein (putative c-di-GMP-specific phosphodiesterase class I)